MGEILELINMASDGKPYAGGISQNNTTSNLDSDKIFLIKAIINTTWDENAYPGIRERLIKLVLEYKKES